jgi:hypothetical protein
MGQRGPHPAEITRGPGGAGRTPFETQGKRFVLRINRGDQFRRTFIVISAYLLQDMWTSTNVLCGWSCK